MASLDLVFSRARYSGGPLDLVFGGGGGEPPALPLTAEITLYLSGPVVSMTAIYDNRLPNYVTASAALRHQSATPEDAERAAGWAQPAPITGEGKAGWQSATDAQGLPAVGWNTTAPMASERREQWEAADKISAQAELGYQVCGPVDLAGALRWQAAQALARTLVNRHQVGTPALRQAVIRMRQGLPLARTLINRHQVATPALVRLLARWQEARPLPPGLSIYVPPGGGDGTSREISLDLLFACPPYEPGAPLDLVFGHVCLPPVGPSATLYILPARYYMAVHSLSAVRLPDLEPVTIFDVSLAADKGSFDWSLTARVRREAIEQFAPVSGLRPSIRITLDGIDFVFVVEKVAPVERFGSNTFTLTGRSVTSLIAGKRARETSRLNATAANAQQLALAALEFTGVDLDWGIPDWLVSAGAWSHTGTPLAAVQAIVEAAGGYLQSHRTLPELLARHPYPDLPGGLLGVPWNWESASFAADVELALDPLMVVGTDPVDDAEINGVYVSGVNQGFRVFYKRSGTAGNLLAPMVSDPLIVAPEVARMRGRSIVGATGAKHLVSIELPVLTGPSQPGILDVGQLVQINASSLWRGRVRSVRASAKFGEKVRQTVQLERHLEQV